MEGFGPRLKRLRERAELTQERVADALGVARNTVATWERSKERRLDSALYAGLATVLGVTVDELAGGDRTGTDAVRVASVPVLGTIRMGVPVEAQEDRIGMVMADPKWGADFALRARGDSMEPDLRDGDLVYMRKVDGARAELVGQIVAALVNGGDVTLKRLVLEGSRWALRAANPAYPDIACSEGDRVQAVMVAWARGAHGNTVAAAMPRHREGGEPAVDDRWQALAAELARALTMREENERLRIERVEAVRAEAERLAQENVRVAMEEMRAQGARGCTPEGTPGVSSSPASRAE